MQHLKEFLTRIQTFDLRIIEDDIVMETGTNEKKHAKAYDLTYQTIRCSKFAISDNHACRLHLQQSQKAALLS